LGCEQFDFDRDGDIDLIDYGAYSRTLTGDCGIAIALDPEPATVCSGDFNVFTAAADRPANAFQWRRNGILLPGQSADSLILNFIDSNDAGFYQAAAIGDCHTAYSEAAALVVNPAITITSQPEDAVSCPEASAEFEVSAAGMGPFTYQWQFEGDDIDGATDSTLVVEALTDNDLGDYRCEVTDVCGTVKTSNQVELVFPPEPVFIDSVEDVELCMGETALLFINAANAETFQWFKDDAPIAGEVNFFLLIPSASDSDEGDYRLDAIGACATTSAPTFTLTVVDCP
jgi:hypothetical protein